MKPLFIALGLNVITKRFYDTRDVLSAVAIQRNVGAGHANLPLCKSQQGSSPQGEGESFAVSPEYLRLNLPDDLYKIKTQTSHNGLMAG
jgi:hypothetical protein